MWLLSCLNLQEYLMNKCTSKTVCRVSLMNCLFCKIMHHLIKCLTYRIFAFQEWKTYLSTWVYISRFIQILSFQRKLPWGSKWLFVVQVAFYQDNVYHNVVQVLNDYQSPIVLVSDTFQILPTWSFYRKCQKLTLKCVLTYAQQITYCTYGIYLLFRSMEIGGWH